MDLPATQLLNDDDDDSFSSQSLNSSQVTPKKVHQVANLCIGNKKYPIFKGINKIGRNPGCDVCINDLSVSKNHAEIEIKTNCFYICDLRSSNKTRINNEALRPDRFYQIVDGSKLTFGIINAQFLLLRDNNDSIIVPETPAPGLKLRYDGNKSSITDSDDSVILGTQEAKDEAVFAKPTLPIRSPNAQDARRKLNTSIHDIETQKFNQSDENNDPSIFECETHKINNSSKKNSLHDIETQQLDDNGIKNEVFDLATQKLPDEPNVESDIYSMGTQQINTENNRGIYDLDTQKMDVKDDVSSVYDVATQRIATDDDIYNCETQRINKQFEITISKCKKSRVSNKNSNLLKEVTVVLQRSDTKNGEEDNRKQQHVSTVVDDSETDDELTDDIKSKQNSSVHQSSTEITIVAKKSNDSNKVSSTYFKVQNHFIDETDDESETDDEEAVVNLKSRVHDEVNNRLELGDKEPLKNNKVGSGSETDDEELAQSQDKKQSKNNNDNKNSSSFEIDDEIPLSKKPESLSVTSVGKNKILNKGVDSEAENNACPSPVLVDFSKIQQPGTGLNSDNDETDDDEIYITPNQIVSPHKKIPPKSEEPGFERYDTVPLVAVSPRNSELDCDPDALTQIIPSINNACEGTNKLLNDGNKSHEVPDDFAPTQLITPQNNCKDDDETDDEEVELSRNGLFNIKTKISVSKDQIKKIDDLASTQIVDFTDKISTTCDQDLCDAPTQLLNLETQAVHNGIEDTQKLLETHRDDLEPTQLIDSQRTFSSMCEKRINSQPAKMNKQSRNKDKINDDDDIDSDDFDNAPTQIINFENDNLDYNSSSVVKSHRFSRRASSIPVSEVKKKVSSSSMKNLRVNLDKLPNIQSNDLNINEKNIVDNKKINAHKKTKLKYNDDDDKLNSDLYNDSLDRNLDAMFGGSNDDELENTTPLQTQQLKEILSDVPETLHNFNNFQKSSSQDNKTNLRNTKIGESRVDSRESTLNTQEIHFAKLSSKKKKSNVLVDSQGSSASQTVVKNKSKAAKEIVYAPGTAGFSKGVPVESDESIGVYESPNKKFKPKVKVTENSAKSECETKQTANPVNEDDFFAGLPDVRIAGTEACPASSIDSSSDSEDDYSTGNIVKKLQKSMAEIKAMEENDEDYGIFSKSKQIPKQSNSSLSKIKNIDNDDSSSDGEVDFARLKQLADRLLNANDKEKILTGLKGVSSNINNNKKQIKKETVSNLREKKSTRKRVLPQKLNDGTFTLDNTLNDVTSLDDIVPAKRSRRARKNSESNTSTISVNSSVGETKAQVETKKKAVTKRSKKIDVDQSLSSTSISLGTGDKKIKVETKKKATSKRSKPTNNEMNLVNTSSSSVEEQKVQVETKTAAKRTKKVDVDKTDFNASTLSTTSSSTLNSSILSKRSRASVMDSSSTSAHSRHSTRPAEKMQYKIIFTGINCEDHEHAIQRLGGIVSNDPMTGTVLVTDKVRRTLKFICAISRSIPIVSENWIKACIQSNKFVGTDEYILSDPAAEAKFKFNLQHSLIKSKERSLLHNQTFVITAGVNQPSVNELKNMIQAAGGKALVRAPKTWSNTFIVSCEADIPKVKKLIANIPINIQVPVVTTEFLLAGILKQELDVKKHTLSF